MNRNLTRLFSLLTIMSTFLMAGCSATGLLNGVTAGNSYTLNADIAYGEHPRQKLDIYTPAAASPATGWPVVVFIYGGSWNDGARSQYQFVGEAMAARGVVTLVADYRLYNVKASWLEHLLHRAFAEVRLNLTQVDKKGRDCDPTEWFVVPRDTINKAVAMIMSGEITDYVYDAQLQKLVERV